MLRRSAQVLSERLGLSENVAGITLLALGNGAPDVFTAYSAINSADDFPLVLAELLGASIFVTTVVLAAVLRVARAPPSESASEPSAADGAGYGSVGSTDVGGAAAAAADDDGGVAFRLPRGPFLRDLGVFVVSISCILAFTLDGKIVIAESVSLMLLYFA